MSWLLIPAAFLFGLMVLTLALQVSGPDRSLEDVDE